MTQLDRTRSGWRIRRRSKREPLIALESLSWLTDLDAAEILDRVLRGHLRAFFGRADALRLMLRLKRERARRDRKDAPSSPDWAERDW